MDAINEPTEPLHELCLSVSVCERRCAACGTFVRLSTDDQNTILALPIRAGDGRNLKTTQESLNEYMRPYEFTDQRDFLDCATCEHHGRNLIHLRVTRAPQVLFLQLKCWETVVEGGRQRIKLWDHKVLASATISFGGCEYALRGFVVHDGPLATSGHYRCWAKNTGVSWLLYDDSRVERKVFPTAVPPLDRQSKVYLCVYERVDAVDADVVVV